MPSPDTIPFLVSSSTYSKYQSFSLTSSYDGVTGSTEGSTSFTSSSVLSSSLTGGFGATEPPPPEPPEPEEILLLPYEPAKVTILSATVW